MTAGRERRSCFTGGHRPQPSHSREKKVSSVAGDLPATRQGVKKKTNRQPSRPHLTILRQLVELIPTHLVAKLARAHGVDRKARTFTPWSHVVALLYAQLAHALSLNDVCDGLRLWATPLRALRGARPPSRNALSHANKIRDCAIAEQLFLQVPRHLTNSFPRLRQ